MIVIDGIEYTAKNVPSSKKILVLVHGHVLIGDVEKVDGGYALNNGSVIRNWGTDKGIGQIAKKNGGASPTLDPLNGAVFVNEQHLIFSIDVEE